jgi:transposase-like protein
VERKKRQRYPNDFRKQAVERMNACDNIVALARELGVARRLLYVWRDRFDETECPAIRSRELILRRQVLRFKRLLANKTLEVDFFKHALRRVGARRPKRNGLGDKHLRTNKKGNSDFIVGDRTGMSRLSFLS